jgi:uncharacterized membrane protein
MSKGRKKPRERSHKHLQDKAVQSTASADWIVTALAGVGMLITAYLTSVAWFGDSPAFCAEGSGCDLIQHSRWSTVLGMPVALWGFAVYLVIGLIAWRMPARLKRWRQLWYLSLIGLAISVYLTVVGIVSLDAVCAWCLASLATMTAIFVRLILHHPDSAPGVAWPSWLAQTGGAALLVVALLHLSYSDLLSHPDTPKLRALAAHLDETGARFYGAWWCPACQEQKDQFRGAAEQLPYIECSIGGRGSPMTLECRNLGITNYPTWIIDDTHYTGIVSPQDLAIYSDYDWE